MTWQLVLYDDVRAGLPPTATADLVGSARRPELLDGWSDLDVHLTLAKDVALSRLLGAAGVWALEEACSPDEQVLRIVLSDGRRVDIVVAGTGRVLVPPASASNAFRFCAAQAAAKLGRDDRLIGLHLVLELCRLCLVDAMLLRDRDAGTNAHRSGSTRDALAREVQELTGRPLDLRVRPNVVELAAGLHDRWQHELDGRYEPDWSGLQGVLKRGWAGRDPG